MLIVMILAIAGISTATNVSVKSQKVHKSNNAPSMSNCAMVDKCSSSKEKTCMMTGKAKCDMAMMKNHPVAVAKTSAKSNAGNKVKIKAKRPVICPVMGSLIPEASKGKYGKSVYKGKTYYFCCSGCKPLFDKNPEKYIKK